VHQIRGELIPTAVQFFTNALNKVHLILVGRFVSKHSEGWRDGLLAGMAGVVDIDIFR